MCLLSPLPLPCLLQVHQPLLEVGHLCRNVLSYMAQHSKHSILPDFQYLSLFRAVFKYTLR